MAFSSFRKRFGGDEKTPQAATTAADADIPSTSAPSTDGESIHTEQPDLRGPIDEKDKAVGGIDTTALEDGQFADDDPAVRDIPWQVRRVVSLTDDPTLPTLTFRYFILTLVFVAPGAFLSQMSSFRTTEAPYSVFFVQIASNYVGLWLAKVLPAKVVKVPFTNLGFSLNPGPWSVKEHVLVTISAASGATYNLA